MSNGWDKKLVPVSPDRAIFYTVEAEVLEADKTCLVKTPEVLIRQHFLLLIRRTVDEPCPEADGGADTVWLTVPDALHQVGFPFVGEGVAGTAADTEIAISAEVGCRRIGRDV